MKQICSAAILIFTFCFAAFGQTNKNVCPEISFVSSTHMPMPQVLTIFSAKVGEGAEKHNLSYEWAVSKGKIVKGQGTSEIKFLAAEEDAGANFNVFVKVFGLPKGCSGTYSEILGIAPLIEGDPYDRLGKPGKRISGEYLAGIDSFIHSVGDNPGSEGLITIVFGKNDSRNYKISLLRKINKVCVFNHFNLTQITFAFSEDNYPEETTLWIVPPGAEFPKYAKYYTIIKAEELEQKIKELFSK